MAGIDSSPVYITSLYGTYYSMWASKHQLTIMGNGNINDIQPEFLFEKMMDVLKGIVTFNDKIISYDNKENFI